MATLTPAFLELPAGPVADGGSQLPPYFDQQAFDRLVQQKGRPVRLSQALNCPCRLTANDSPRTDCRSCGGVGWIWINPSTTHAVVQGMGYQGKQLVWTEANSGTMRITTREQDRLSLGDRIELLVGESVYTQTLQPRQRPGGWIAYTIYDPLRVEALLVFVAADQPLVALLDEDYTIEGNVLTLTEQSASQLLELANYEGEGFPPLTIRYRHRPAFVVIDVPRDLMTTPGAPDGKSQQMPLHAVARRVHLMVWRENAPSLARLTPVPLTPAS